MLTMQTNGNQSLRPNVNPPNQLAPSFALPKLWQWSVAAYSVGNQSFCPNVNSPDQLAPGGASYNANNQLAPL